MNLKELISEPILRQFLLGSPNCMMPLFHGTDRAILAMTQQERVKLRTACATVIDYLLPIYEENKFGNRKPDENKRDLKELHAKVVDARGKATLRKEKNSLYSYENVYLTFDPHKAEVFYAPFASICGELGYIAYWLLQGAKRLGYTFPPQNEAQFLAIQMVEDAGTRIPDPVIVMYFNIPKERLKTERGRDIDWERQVDSFLRGIHYGEVRVVGEFNISNGIITSIEELKLQINKN